VVEAEAAVLLEEEEGFQVAGAHLEEVQEEALARAQTGVLQEVEDEASLVVVEATKVMLHHCLHVAYAAFGEYPQGIRGWLLWQAGRAVCYCNK
jgi:hypothetical protein